MGKDDRDGLLGANFLLIKSPDVNRREIWKLCKAEFSSHRSSSSVVYMMYIIIHK